MPLQFKPPPVDVLNRLRMDRPLIAAELRPPRTGLSPAKSMDTWIDMYHVLRRLATRDMIIFVTDNAVGQSEEENLNHITANLAGEVDPSKIVPFLTCKHGLDYCLTYAARAASHDFQAVAVLGGDKSVGPARCVANAYILRQMIRERVPSLRLGGWANPHRDPREQAEFLLRQDFAAEFYLTQIVSHYDIHLVESFLAEARRRKVTHPAVFGVFLYRSANPRTLERLGRFFPLPADQVTQDFESGLSGEQICARTIRALRDVGADKVYVSNLGFRRAEQRYRQILAELD